MTIWWRVALIIVALFSTSFIGFLFPYPNFQYLIELGNNIPWLWSWGGFDGIHYITIAESGYVADNTQAFFPVYPYLVEKVSSILGLNALVSGLVVSNLALLFVTGLFWSLLRLDNSENLSKKIIALFLLFPTAFYLGALYTESIFLALVFGTFLSARKGKWFLAGLLGALASATRPMGIFLFPAMIIEWWQSKIKDQRLNIKDITAKNWMDLLWILLIPMGLVLYMIYLNNHFDDALKFIHSQPGFGASRSDKIVLIYQVFWRYIKMIFTVAPFSLLYLRILQELFWSALFLVLGILSFKKTRLSYAVFSMFSYILPTLTGTFSSMPRYVLVMFPAFIILAGWFEEKNHSWKIWCTASAVLLIINLMTFLSGRWVA